jgi:hypothetical protein
MQRQILLLLKELEFSGKARQAFIAKSLLPYAREEREKQRLAPIKDDSLKTNIKREIKALLRDGLVYQTEGKNLMLVEKHGNKNTTEQHKGQPKMEAKSAATSMQDTVAMAFATVTIPNRTT